MPELVFFRRGEEVLRVAVDRARVVLGRGDSSDVAIPDPEVSRQQVALLWDGQKCRVEDLSGKGTKVAGAVVERGDLPDGADIELGQWRAVFRQHGASETRTPPRRRATPPACRAGTRSAGSPRSCA
ncbi:FHA domain-containing protein [Corallococcus sp. 4LFB]|uniref:FHA domain-containing protein n=1 Tax=Corallococcus sp. 4LFB TaxID=3383249 RepID=UPI0039747F88